MAPSRRAVAIAWRPATPAPSTSTLAGPDRAGRRGEHREEAGQLLRRDLGGAVAADGRLRGERVHRLGARDARDGLHGEARHAGLGQRPHGVGRRQRRQEADQHRAARRGGRSPRPRAARPWRRPRPTSRRRRGAGLLVVGVRVVGGLRRRRPRSSTSMPPRPSRSTTSGTSATRRSPLAVSLGTETFIGRPAARRGARHASRAALKTRRRTGVPEEASPHGTSSGTPR